MRYLSLLVLCIIYHCTTANAQNVFTGIIKDISTGKPLPGVTVFISDLKESALSNDSGYFSISFLPNGSHTIELSCVGYESVVETFSFVAGKTYIFQLSPTILENKTVVVTGIVRAANVRNVPIKVTVLKAAEMDRLAPGSLVERISSIPGISNLSTGNGIGKPVIRGLGNSRVLVVQDGVRLEGQQWGDEHGLEIDDAMVQRVEILKGPASLVYGSDAMAGVINIISDIQVSEGVWKGNISSDYQTNSQLRSVSGWLATQQKGTTLQMSLSTRASADYENRADGRVFNSRFRQSSAGIITGIKRKWGYARIGGNYYHLKAGIVEGLRDSLGQFTYEDDFGNQHTYTGNETATLPQAPYQDVDHIKVYSDNSFKVFKKRLYLNVSMQQNHRKEYGHFTTEGPELDFRLNTLGWVSRLFLVDKSIWDLTTGITGMYQGNKNHLDEYIIPDYNLVDAGVFVYAQRKFQKLTIAGGARVDTRNIAVKEMTSADNEQRPGFQKSLQNISGSIGFAWIPNLQSNIKLNLSHSYRAPSMAELSSYGAHEGTLRFEYGNSKLKNEMNWQGDVTIEKNTNHFSLSASGFANYFSNYIFYQRLAAYSGGDSVLIHHSDTLSAYAFNEHKAYMWGMEITIDVHPHPLDWLHLKTAFSLVNGRFVTPLGGSSNLPLLPAPHILSEIRVERKGNRIFSNLYAKAEADVNLKQNHPFTGYNTETNTNAYTLINFSVGGNWVYWRNRYITFHFTAMNIFDKIYQSHLSRLKYTNLNPVTLRKGVFNMGRSFSIRLQMPFEITGTKK